MVGEKLVFDFVFLTSPIALHSKIKSFFDEKRFCDSITFQWFVICNTNKNKEINSISDSLAKVHNATFSIQTLNYSTITVV